MDAPIRWSHGALELLGQTRLPAEQRWIRCESPEDVAGAIRRLAVRGAPPIGLAAAHAAPLGMRTAAGDGTARARFAAPASVPGPSRPTPPNRARAARTPSRLVSGGRGGALWAGGRVDRVSVGADGIARTGDGANKVGTSGVAVLAARHGIPFYVAAPLSTLDPATPTGSEIEIEHR